jgi:hypothetical protein
MFLPGESASGWGYLSTHYVVVAWSGTGPRRAVDNPVWVRTSHPGRGDRGGTTTMLPGRFSMAPRAAGSRPSPARAGFCTSASTDPNPPPSTAPGNSPTSSTPPDERAARIPRTAADEQTAEARWLLRGISDSAGVHRRHCRFGRNAAVAERPAGAIACRRKRYRIARRSTRALLVRSGRETGAGGDARFRRSNGRFGARRSSTPGSDFVHPSSESAQRPVPCDPALHPRSGT